MVHDFNFSFTQELVPRVNTYLRSWAGLFARADAGVLYRSRANFGLQLNFYSYSLSKNASFEMQHFGFLN
jgi:hypothetical protein